MFYKLFSKKNRIESICHKLKFSNTYIFATKSVFDILNLDNLIQQNFEFEISKVYDTGLQRYRN